MKYFIHARTYYPLNSLIFRVAENLEAGTRTVYVRVVSENLEITVGDINSSGTDTVDLKDFIKKNSVELY